MFHHLAITWNNDGGILEFIVDGVLRSSRENIQSDQVIAGSGTLVIGQLQRAEGEFEAQKGFYGQISQLNIWDTVLSPEMLVLQAKYPGTDHGNVVAWETIKDHVSSSVEVISPAHIQSSCKFEFLKLES